METIFQIAEYSKDTHLLAALKSENFLVVESAHAEIARRKMNPVRSQQENQERLDSEPAGPIFVETETREPVGKGLGGLLASA